MIKHSGSIDRKRGRFYPVAYWNKKEIVQYIKNKKLKLGADSKNFGFSFKSLDGKELRFIKERYPADFEKILRLYPFAGAAVTREEQYGDQ